MIEWMLDDHPFWGFSIIMALVLAIIGGIVLLLIHLLGGHVGCPPGQQEIFRYFITVKTVLVPIYSCGPVN